MLLRIIERADLSDFTPCAVGILATLVRRSRSLAFDPSFQAAAGRLISERGRCADLAPLCLAFLGSRELPPPQLFQCFIDHINGILADDRHSALGNAFAFMSACVRRECFCPFANISSRLPGWLGTSVPRTVVAILDYLCAMRHCDELLCDVLLSRLPEWGSREAPAGDELDALIRAMRLFSLAADELQSRSAGIVRVLLKLMLHAEYAVRAGAVICLLQFIGDVPFSADLCGIFLEFYDVPIASNRIFGLFCHWAQFADDQTLEIFVEMIGSRMVEILDFLESSDSAEHRLFARYLSVIDGFRHSSLPFES
jgi:hypothetical protein